MCLGVDLMAEQTFQLGENLGEQVFAAQIGNGALLDLAVVAIGFDDADVLVNRAAGGPDFDGSEVHVVKYHDATGGNQGENWENRHKIGSILLLHFSGRTTCVARQTLENRGNQSDGRRAEADFTPNIG